MAGLATTIGYYRYGLDQAAEPRLSVSEAQQAESIVKLENKPA